MLTFKKKTSTVICFSQSTGQNVWCCQALQSQFAEPGWSLSLIVGAPKILLTHMCVLILATEKDP